MKRMLLIQSCIGRLQRSFHILVRLVIHAFYMGYAREKIMNSQQTWTIVPEKKECQKNFCYFLDTVVILTTLTPLAMFVLKSDD